MYLRSATFILPVILATVLAACSHSQAHSNANAAPPQPSVTVAAVISRPLHHWEELTGELQAVNSVEVRPRVTRLRPRDEHGRLPRHHVQDLRRVRRRVYASKLRDAGQGGAQLRQTLLRLVVEIRERKGAQGRKFGRDTREVEEPVEMHLAHFFEH